MIAGAFSIILNQESKVLLCKRRDKDLWNLPGGRVEPDESPWEAAIREAREEIQVDIQIERLAGTYFKREADEVVFQFLARIENGVPTESDEVAEIRYFSAGDLPQNTAPKQRERIRLFFEDPDTLQMLVQ